MATPKGRTWVVAFSVSDEEHRRLRVAAARKGLPMSKFSRDAAAGRPVPCARSPAGQGDSHIPLSLQTG